MGCYRFFENKQTDLSSIIDANCSHWLKASPALLDAGSHYLVVSDTTSLDWSAHSGQLKVNDPDLGPLECGGVGFFLHPSLVLAADNGFPLGLSNVVLWSRTFDGPDKTQRGYKSLPYPQKESYIWAKGLQGSRARLATSEARCTYVMDREGDIYDLFCLAQGQDLLIRSAQNRRLIYQGEQTNLKQHLSTLKPTAAVELDLARTQDRVARKAIMEVSFSQVEVIRPAKQQDTALPPKRRLCLLNIEESDHSVPPGEDPVHWVLWTTHKVDSIEQAMAVVQWYKYRWVIETLFGVLKSRGLDIEASRLESGTGLQKLSVMALQTALTILQLRSGREKSIQQPVELIFSDEQISCLQNLCPSLEGKTQKQQNPFDPASLPWAVWSIARLGGWKGYYSQAPPGIETMARGWKEFQTLFKGWTLFNANKDMYKE